MAIDSYTTLKASIQTWLAESALLVSVVDDLIAFCEDDLNTDPEFRVLEMQQVKVSNLNAGDENVTLPLDYLEMQYVTETTAPDRPPLTYVSPQGLAAQTDDCGYLAYYTIVGGKLRLNREPSAGQQLEMGYYGKIPRLSASNTTNWLLSKSRQVYLYGSLVHAEPYLQNDPRIVTWKALHESAKQKIIDASRAAESSGGTLQVGLPEAVA